MNPEIGFPIHRTVFPRQGLRWPSTAALPGPAGEGSGAGRLLPPHKSLLNTMGHRETTVSTAPFDVKGFSNLFGLDEERGSQGRQRSAR